MKSWLAAVALPMLLAPFASHAASSASEDWMLYEQGNAAMAQREFGKALSLYKEAILRAGVFPEAEMAIGDVYTEEGELDLALAQYDKAYNLRKSLMVPDMQYDVLYKSANLLQATGRYKAMEDKLTLIVQDDSNYQETANMRMRSQVEKNYNDKGLDRVLVLYSFDRSFAAAAHASLGWFYYRTGRYAAAVSHLLYATIYRTSQINRFLRDRDVDYQFMTMKGLLGSFGSSSEITTFVADTEYYKCLYYLAAASFANEQAEEARSLWILLSSQTAAGTYQDLSARQLKRPFLGPLLAQDDQQVQGN